MANEDGEYTAPATQDELNALIASRLERERAKYAGFDEFKEKAGRLDELEEKNRTDLEKAEARAVAAEQAIAERDAADAKAKAEADAAAELAELTKSVAEAKGVDAALLRGGSKEDLEKHADLVLAAIGEQKPRRNYNPAAGTGGDQAVTGSLAAGRERAKARSK